MDYDYERRDPYQEEMERQEKERAAEERRQKRKNIRKEKAARDREEMMSKEYIEKIENDKEVEETETPDLDGYLSDEEINRIWAEHMHDFVPEDMMNVLVEQDSQELLFEEIGHTESTLIRGAYYVLGGNPDRTINCMVYDPMREVIYKRSGSA